MIKRIAKYDYLNFKRCPLLFNYSWIDFHCSENGVNPLKDFLTAQGKEVGLLAQQLFTDKNTYTVHEKNIALAVMKTKEAFSKADIIFEGAFEYEGLVTRPDILHINDKELIEIKSTTEVKEDHLYDVAFQKYILNKCGLEIKTVKIGHINKQYIREGDLNLNGLFSFVDVTEMIVSKISEIEQDLVPITNIIKNGYLPEREIGRHCNSDTGCPYKKECWGESNNDTIFNLRRDVSGKKYDLHKGGILSLKDIPEYVSLTKFQALQKEAEIQNCAIINQAAMVAALNEVVYPIYFLDFETFNNAVPELQNTTPYQQIPFQVSIHSLKAIKQKPKHFSFLHIDNSDPRKALANFLLDSLGESGSIVAYHASFEIGRLYELIKVMPEKEAEILALIDRVWDLEKNFDKGLYVHPDFLGSTSIKKILPVMCPELSYEHLGINNGALASIQYLKMISPHTPKDEKNKIRNDLEIYCCLDTFALYTIFKKLIQEIL